MKNRELRKHRNNHSNLSIQRGGKSLVSHHYSTSILRQDYPWYLHSSMNLHCQVVILKKNVSTRRLDHEVIRRDGVPFPLFTSSIINQLILCSLR